MARALILLAAALAVGFLPVSRVIRAVVIVVLVIAAGIVAWIAELQDRERELQATEITAAEAARWAPALPGQVRIVGWDISAPLRFPERWVVDVVFAMESRISEELTGVEVTLDALDCADRQTPAADCATLGQASASATFLPIANQLSRRVRMRFDFGRAPFPSNQLRIAPTVTAVRR
jgi:hypothetical protein